MKTDIELLELLKEVCLSNLYSGLCSCNLKLFVHRQIISQEENRLSDLIKEMKPSRKPVKTIRGDWLMGYYWNSGEIKPRINAINELIKIRQAT